MDFSGAVTNGYEIDEAWGAGYRDSPCNSPTGRDSSPRNMENLTMNTLTPSLQRTSAWARSLAAVSLVAGAWALTSFGSQAHARGDVYWSVGVNGPGVSIGASNAPAVVYQPPGYYYEPRPVLVQPAPVYYERPPVYYQRPPVIYAPPVVYAPPAVIGPRPIVISGRGPGYWDDDRGRGNRHGHRHGHGHGRDRDWDDDGHRGGGRGRH